MIVKKELIKDLGKAEGPASAKTLRLEGVQHVQGREGKPACLREWKKLRLEDCQGQGMQELIQHGKQFAMGRHGRVLSPEKRINPSLGEYKEFYFSNSYNSSLI